jgi:hypothetical protein
MNNAAPRRLYEGDELPKQLAPVIPIKPVKRVKQQKVSKTVTVKTGNQDITPVPAFTAPVFKPKRHDML